MSFYPLDKNGKRIGPRSRKEPHTRLVKGVPYFHYQIRYDLPVDPQTGKRRQRIKRAWLVSDDAAMSLERELRGKPEANAVTWSQGWSIFRAAYAGRRTESYIRHMERDIQRLIEFAGDIPIRNLTVNAFHNYLLLRSPNENSTGAAAALAHRHCRNVAKWLQRRGYIEKAPFMDTPAPEYSVQKHRRCAATIEEFTAVAKKLPPYMFPLWLALGYTGSRIGGMAELTEDRVGDTHITTNTKNGQVVQFLLTDPLRYAIALALALKRQTGVDSPFVFVNSRGHPWNPSSYTNAIHMCREKHPEVPDIVPHQLRHMWGTTAAMLNFSPDMIQAGMGHTNRHSAETYIHQTQDMADSVAAKVITLLSHCDTVSEEHEPYLADFDRDAPGLTTCPKCGHKFLP